ncbi:MAG: calcium-binding protein [Selenomonadaceae bacterium]|nr:calcium-binding protein [Selenomonadaceae bacterium]
MTTENTVSGILINGTAGNDSIVNFGDDVTIDSGSGNDTIYSGLDDRKADRVSINAGEGDNVVSIQSGSDSVTIRTGDGNNLIGSTSPNNAVFTGSGNDSVVFYTGSDNNTVETGDGDDVIQAVGHNVTIDTGAGNDSIRTFRNAYDITIKAGTGDDDITLGGPVDTDHTNVVQYADGDGNDTITTFSATDSLQITSGSISGASLVGNNVEISVGSGTITLLEANNMNINIVDANGILHQTIFSGGSSDDTVVNDTLIAGTEGDDYLINDKGKNVTINGYAGNDTIDNTGDNSIIDAGAGNDIVSVAGASNVTIRTGDGDNTVYSDSNGASELVYFGNGKNTIVTSNRHSTILGGIGGNVITLHNGSFGSSVRAGSGNDTVQVGHYGITVDGGNGNDLINLYRDAENALIIMGTGNDTVTVYNNTHAQTFQYSGGNDLINGFKANDTLKIVGATSANTIVSDGNLIFDFGDGKLTLAGVSSVENVEYLSKWTTIEGGGWAFNSVAQRDFNGYYRDDKAAQFSISGGNLEDTDGDGAPDNVSIGSIIYVPQSGVHTNVRNLSGNVIYNGDALGVEGDDSYNIEAVSPIDLSETFAGTYITNPHVTAMRLISDGATISPRGDSGTGTVPADWYSFDNAGGTVTFMDGSYCVYTENKFSTRNYTKLTIENSNLPDIFDVSSETSAKELLFENLSNGVEVTTADDLIQKIGNLKDGYKITIESGINVGEKINFETSGDGVIVVKTTANTDKYSLDADSDEWQYQRYSIYGGNDFTFVFGENGSVVGMENFDGTLTTNDTTLIKGEWVTLSSGGFEYTGNATNNPSKSTTFTVSGDEITNTDNLSVDTNQYFAALNGNRVALSGLSGNATIDDIELGVSGDSNYSAHFTKTDDQSPINIVLMNVSDGATVDSNYTAGVDNNGLIKFSDGKHSVLTSDNPQGKVTSIEASNGGDGFELNVSDGIFSTIGGLNDGYAVTINAGDNIGDELTFQTDGGNGTIAIADETLSAGGESDFTVEFDDDGKIISEHWETIKGGFVYSGHATNNYAKTADVSLIGSELKDTNGDGAPDNISVNSFTYSSVTGVMAFMSGFSGEVSINNSAVGLSGDDDYEVHFTAKVIDNAPANVKAYAEMKEIRGISTGATVNPNANDIVGFDSNAKVHMGDVENVYLYNKNHKSGGSPHAQLGIDNNGAGADLTFRNDILTKIDGLEEGYSVSLVASDNVSDELKFSDVPSGNFELTSSIDDTVQVSFKGTSSAQSITGSGNSVKLIGSSSDDLLIAGATNTTLTGGKGSDTFRGGAGLTNCVITDYTEGEDIIAHGRPFADMSINGYTSGNDYIFDVAQAGRTITVKNGANKIIKVVDADGEERLFGKYLTLDDNDPATVTAQDGVLTIDASARTEDIEITGNSGDNLIITGATNSTLTGGAGNDTFRGSAGMETALITDYTEGEDVIYHGRPFSEFSLNGYISGKDYIFDVAQAGRTITVKDGADKVITVTNVDGETRLFGKYLTLDDNDPATVIAQDGVATIDPSARTTDIEITGNDGDNTMISSAGNCTLTGGKGKDTFIRSSRGGTQTIVVTDFDENEDEVYHGIPFANFSLLDIGGAVGDDYVFNAFGATIKYLDGANKKIKFVDVNGDVAYFGNYLTILNVDSGTVEASEKVKVLDATERTKDVKLIGNALDNTIYAGKGNSTLTGGNGADLFVYSAGNAVITDYTTNDKISLGAAITSTSLNGSDVVLMFDNNSLTIKDAKDKTLNLIDSSGVGNATVISVDTTQLFSDLVSDVTTQASKVDRVAANATGTRDITMSGGEAAIIAKTSAEVNITASAGRDTIISQGENVNISLTGGNTRIFPLDGKITLENYDASTGSGFSTPYENIYTAVADGSIDFNNGYLSLDSAQVYMGNNSELINFYNIAGKQQKVGYASSKDSLDASTETKNLLLVAKQNGTIKGGTGNDTIFAQGGNFIDSGEGSNLIKSIDGDTNIVLNGETTVEGFHTGFGNGSDTVYIVGNPASVNFLEDGLTFYRVNDSLTLSDVNTTAKVNIFHERRDVLNKGVFIAAGDWYKVENSDLTVNTGEEVYFVGTSAKPTAGVDFSNVTGDLNITLDTEWEIPGNTMWVNGIYSLKGGAGNTSITGSDKNDTILAGTGETSINGGAGHDKMFGNTDADKKVATFFYTPGDGRDSIENFDFMSDAQDVTADKVKFDDNSAITDVFLRGDDVGIRVDGGKEFLMLEGAQGKSFRLNDDLIAKVDTNVEFDGYTNYYVGIGARASLTVGKGAGNVEVWLSDDSLDYHGKIYDGNFAVLDASQSDGNNILAGNELSNVITGGSGENSLWGGYGSESDTLIGGTGQNTFYYGAGNGNDNIQNAHDGDTVILDDINLDQISDANITAGGVIFKFTDGGSLTVDGTADVTYQLADGSKYSANHSTHDWDSK